MTNSPDLPTGRLRVSGAVLDRVVTVAASGVHGVLSTESLVGAAALGGTVGGALGLVQGGPVGAAVGVSVGTAAGVAVAHAVHDRRRLADLQDVTGPGWNVPPLRVTVVARYGLDLPALADRVRTEVATALEDAVGLRPSDLTVEVIDVDDPGARSLPAA